MVPSVMGDCGIAALFRVTYPNQAETMLRSSLSAPPHRAEIHFAAHWESTGALLATTFLLGATGALAASSAADEAACLALSAQAQAGMARVRALMRDLELLAEEQDTCAWRAGDGRAADRGVWAGGAGCARV